MRRAEVLTIFVILLFTAGLEFAGATVDSKSTDSRVSIRLIYTNDSMGYLEPCGCGGKYQGGLARRATIIRSLREENPNSLIVDSGNISDEPSKLPVLIRLMADMRYDAIGVGELDSISVTEYLKETAANGLNVVETLSVKGSPVKPYILKEIGGVKVGVVSYGRLTDSADEKQAEALKHFIVNYSDARKLADVLILLDQGGIATKEWLEGEAANLGTPDFVVGGFLNSVLSEEVIVGKTYIVPTSVQGKRIGVADLMIIEGELSNATIQMYNIDKAIAEDEDIRKQISAFLAKSRW